MRTSHKMYRPQPPHFQQLVHKQVQVSSLKKKLDIILELSTLHLVKNLSGLMLLIL